MTERDKFNKMYQSTQEPKYKNFTVEKRIGEKTIGVRTRNLHLANDPVTLFLIPNIFFLLF